MQFISECNEWKPLSWDDALGEYGAVVFFDDIGDGRVVGHVGEPAVPLGGHVGRVEVVSLLESVLRKHHPPVTRHRVVVVDVILVPWT